MSEYNNHSDADWVDNKPNIDASSTTKINPPINDSIIEADENKNSHQENNRTESNINKSTATKDGFIKNIDIDNLPPAELLRIKAAVGSSNIAYYLALIVNLENRSRKLSPQTLAKISSLVPMKLSAVLPSTSLVQEDSKAKLIKSNDKQNCNSR